MTGLRLLVLGLLLAKPEAAVLLDDDFSALPPGMLSPE